MANNAGNTQVLHGTIETTAVFSRDNKHRYLLTKIWDTQKPTATILMIKAGNADLVCEDTTTMLCVTNAYKSEFGSIQIVNLFSSVTDDDFTTDKVNDATIIKCCSESDKIILAFGTGKLHEERKQQIIAALDAYKDKFLCIANEKGRTMFHPLAPSVRKRWLLVPYAPDKQPKEQ